MDSSGRLRAFGQEELMTMENLLDPVEVPEDIPLYKLSGFRRIDRAGNRKSRLKLAKKEKVDWSEYQIYRALSK